MKIPIIIRTKNEQSLIASVFDGNPYKEKSLYRSKLHFKDSHVGLETYDYTINAEITLMTSFGAAAVSDYLKEKLANEPFVKILYPSAPTILFQFIIV